jgi:hypothetical protein
MKVYNILTLYLFGTMVCYIIYRVLFYIVVGEPIIIGNIPNYAPEFFDHAQLFLIVNTLFATILSVFYVWITIRYIYNNELLKWHQYLALFNFSSYLLFYFSEHGAVWLIG